MTSEIRKPGTSFLNALERLRESETEHEAAKVALGEAKYKMERAEWHLESCRHDVATYFKAVEDLAAAMADVVPSDEP